MSVCKFTSSDSLRGRVAGMALSLEDSNAALRCQRNRAVAAATLADSMLTRSGLVCDEAHSKTFFSTHTRPIVRYGSFEELLQTHLKPDPNGEARELLRVLQSVPVLRDELALLDDATLKNVCSFLGTNSRDLARLGSVCRRLHGIAIAFTPPEVVVVPSMVSSHGLMSDVIMDSLCSFFSSYKRGQFVQRLRLVASKYASTLAINDSLPLCSPHAFPALAKVFPSLTYLDLRGVRWNAQCFPGLEQSFFSDLYVATPHLQTLKVGVSLLVYWSPGWWQRLPTLSHFVVGSRRDDQAAALPSDVFEMLRAPQRSWSVKFWCVVKRETLLLFFLATQPLPGVRELALNIGNIDLAEAFSRQPTRAVREESRGRKSAKGSRMNTPRRAAGGNSNEGDLCVSFPSMTALTVANLDRVPLLAHKLLSWISQRAPALRHFNIVTTARIPPPPTRLKRQMMAEQAHLTATS